MNIEAQDGTSLHVKDMGAGQPVLLIHGWPLTGDMFEYQTLALLEAGYRVITHDRRGFGQSGHGSLAYDYDTLADDLASVIETLGLHEVALVGFSMGGGEIARYLARYGSARVRAAAFISSVVPYVWQDDTNPDGVDATVFADMHERVRADRFAFLQSFGKDFYGVGFISRPVSQALLDWTFALGMMASPKATLDCIDAFSRTDFRPDVRAIDVPTLIIHGTADKTVPIDPTGRALAAMLPHATLIEYDGEPHGLFATAAERLNADLLAFLGGRTLPSAERETPMAREPMPLA